MTGPEHVRREPSPTSERDSGPNTPTVNVRLRSLITSRAVMTGRVVGGIYAQHVSVLGTHTLLLAFTGAFLPASTFLFTLLPPQQSSLDKPQPRWLAPITAKPAWTLFWLCAGAGVCQAWWAGWMRQWRRALADDGKEAGNPVTAIARASESKLRAVCSAWLNTFLVSMLFHVVVVLFGAPISSYVPHTYLLSLLLSILTVLVPSYALSLPILWPRGVHAMNSESHIHHIIRLFIQLRLETKLDRALVYPVLGSILGCWMGAFPIPLDWDRPWQSWPLTPAYGALVGHLLGSWISLLVNTTFFFASQDIARHAAPDKGKGTNSRMNAAKKTAKKE